MKLFIIPLLPVILLLHPAHCLEKEITVNIDPGREDCFFQQVKQGEVIDFEYQVIDGGHGDLDITFRLSEPTGRILYADFKKSENNHRTEAAQTGDYKFCFDNTFSSYNTKTVFFELIVERDDDEWGSEENTDINKIEGLSSEEVYDLKVQDIQEVIGRVRNHLTKARHLQDMFKSYEARDRNVAEENFFKVNSFSLVQVIIMISVGIVQVVMVRSLFDDGSKVHKIWKKLDSRR
ncbi:hypothetical protein ILUMI_26964 [Ignelater luminosus]|uniref:GOLD domain-containing protein n=1 Tax=Ignelater luminosus TaxID=2038154 RepID=A0A8K0FYN2_IGNLU|nr:hypothetical protein ILUMI_26964 [Ignelater luminosus]